MQSLFVSLLALVMLVGSASGQGAGKGATAEQVAAAKLLAEDAFNDLETRTYEYTQRHDWIEFAMNSEIATIDGWIAANPGWAFGPGYRQQLVAIRDQFIASHNAYVAECFTANAAYDNVFSVPESLLIWAWHAAGSGHVNLSYFQSVEGYYTTAIAQQASTPSQRTSLCTNFAESKLRSDTLEAVVWAYKNSNDQIDTQFTNKMTIARNSYLNYRASL